MLSADTIVIARSSEATVPNASYAGNTYAFTVRDSYSGLAYVDPQPRRTKDSNYNALKFFQGPSWRTRPNIVVKSDAAA